jgi:hypothetical protein
MPRYRVLADDSPFDQATMQATLSELVRADPECEACYDFHEGVAAWFKLVASSRDIAEREVRDAAKAAGVTDPGAIGGAEAEKD